jgi:hypothetical protein
MGHLDANNVRQYGLRDWIIKYSDGKADLSLVERWINIPYSRGMIHFFHPGLVSRAGVSTIMCQGDESPRSVFACEPIAKTAIDLGISNRTVPYVIYARERADPFDSLSG